MRLLLALLISSPFCFSQSSELLVRSNPSDAQVSINGTVIGRTPLTVPMRGVHLPYSLAVNKNGFETWYVQSFVEPGRSVINADLQSSGFTVERAETQFQPRRQTELLTRAEVPKAEPVRAVESRNSIVPVYPTEVGVFYRAADDSWQELEPEVINWKTGGVLKSVFSLGIVKGDINSHVRSRTSENGVAGTDQFLFVLPEGVSVVEYELLRLRTHSNSREFRLATGGIFHQSGGSNRDLLAFKHQKVAPRTYLVTLPSLSPGQYGFLPPGAFAARTATSIGKIYSFRIGS
jgi:PEGA domain